METVQKLEHERGAELPQLVDRMDSAIGEASTSIGMIMSELVRRSLRGGVNDIAGGIQDYAREQVSTAIDDMMPTVSRAVEELAETTSHRIANEATEKLSEELRIVEARTSGRIGDEIKSVESRTTEKIHEEIKGSEARTSEKLGEEIRVLEARATEKSELIAARVKEEADAALAVVQIAVSESRDRAETTAQDLKDLHQRAKDSWKKMQSELQTIHEARTLLDQRVAEAATTLQDLRQQLEREQQSHGETRSQLQSTAQELSKTVGSLASAQDQLGRTQKALQATREELRQLHEQSGQRQQSLEQLCRTFAGRLEELERPRGLKALFSRFSGGAKKSKTADTPELPGPGESPEAQDG